MLLEIATVKEQKLILRACAIYLLEQLRAANHFAAQGQGKVAEDLRTEIHPMVRLLDKLAIR